MKAEGKPLVGEQLVRGEAQERSEGWIWAKRTGTYKWKMNKCMYRWKCQREPTILYVNSEIIFRSCYRNDQIRPRNQCKCRHCHWYVFQTVDNVWILNLMILYLGQRHNSADKDACCQAWWLEFESTLWWKERTDSTGWPLTSTNTHIFTNK